MSAENTPQLRHFGVDFTLAEIPQFPDGSLAVVEAPSEYLDRWSRTDGCTPPAPSILSLSIGTRSSP